MIDNLANALYHYTYTCISMPQQQLLLNITLATSIYSHLGVEFQSCMGSSPLSLVHICILARV